MIFGEMRRKPGQSFSDQLIAMSENGCVTNIIPADTRTHWRNENATLIQHTLWNTAESKADHNPVADSDTQLTIAAWARIDNREELAAKLNINAANPEISDSNFILSAYQKWGEDCVDHLIGDFVFVIFDGREQKMFCARDHMGVRPFYYHLSGDQFIFASSLMIFHQLESFDENFELKPSQQWMSDFLLELSMSSSTTPYPNILKLPPAHCLTLSAGKSHLRQYFQLSPETTLHLNSSQEYVDAYREMLEESIRCRLRSEYPLGTELSGGIDSSTITAYASRILPQPQSQLHAFAFSDYKKEPEYIDAVSHACSMAATHVFPYSSDFQEEQLLSHSLNILGHPAESCFAIGEEPFYRVAEGFDIRTMLSGFGGDEFVTTHGSLALIELLTRGEYRQLYRITRGNPLTRILRMLKLALRWLHIRNRKYNPDFYETFSQRWLHQPVRDKWVAKFNLHQRYMDMAKFDAGYHNLNESLLGCRWGSAGSVRMENYSLMAAARKIEYRWPLLDVRLVKLFLSIPASEKFANGTSRFLHRRAIDGVVPKKVTWNPTKDMGPLDNDVWDIPTGIALNDLHPALAELLDLEKLGTQMESVLGQGADRESDEFLQISDNIENITYLNQWLHHTQEKFNSTKAGS